MSGPFTLTAEQNQALAAIHMHMSLTGERCPVSQLAWVMYGNESGAAFDAAAERVAELVDAGLVNCDPGEAGAKLRPAGVLKLHRQIQ